MADRYDFFNAFIWEKKIITCFDLQFIWALFFANNRIRKRWSTQENVLMKGLILLAAFYQIHAVLNLIIYPWWFCWWFCSIRIFHLIIINISIWIIGCCVCNFIEIALWHGCFPVNLLHIFRAPFLKNTSEWLLLKLANSYSNLLTAVHSGYNVENGDAHESSTFWDFKT